MNVNSIRPSGIPAARPQDRAGVQENLRRETGAPARFPAQGAPAGRGATAGTQNVLTEEEQRFFEELFPGAVTELQTSPSYSPAGLQPGQATGTLLDRKG